MAILKSKYKYMLDEAPSITLRAKSAAAIATTTGSTVYALEQLDGYWNNANELADQTFAVVVNVDSLVSDDGDETYTLTLQFGDTDNFSTNTNITTHTLVVAGPGQYVMPVDIDTVRNLLPDATHMRILATLAGTTPELDYHAWIAGKIIV